MAECSRKGNLGLPYSLEHEEGAPGVFSGKGTGRGQLLVLTLIRAVPGKMPAYCRVQGTQGRKGQRQLSYLCPVWEGDQAQGGVGKMRSKCASSSSTAWFCWDMPTARLPGSRSGRSSVGPNTMPMFWRVMRLTSACSITLGTHEIQGEVPHATHLAPPFCLCCPWGLVRHGSIALMACPNPSSHPMGTTPSLPSSAPVILIMQTLRHPIPRTPCGASPSPPPARQQPPYRQRWATR